MHTWMSRSQAWSSQLVTDPDPLRPNPDSRPGKRCQGRSRRPCGTLPWYQGPLRGPYCRGAARLSQGLARIPPVPVPADTFPKTQANAAPIAPLRKFQSSLAGLELEPGRPSPKEWVSYPGLFAGGGLDIMTACLLRTLATPEASHRTPWERARPPPAAAHPTSLPVLHRPGATCSTFALGAGRSGRRCWRVSRTSRRRGCHRSRDVYPS